MSYSNLNNLKMEKNNLNFTIEENEHNLYKYSDVDLVSFIKEKNEENNNMNDSATKKKKEFLIEFAIYLEKKLKHNISLHQNGFKIYKQKLLADKSFIQNSISKELRNLTIKQLIELLLNIKNNQGSKKENKYFSIGKNINNSGNFINNEQNSIKFLNNIFSSKNQQNNIKNLKIIPLSDNNYNYQSLNNENNNINMNNKKIEKKNLIYGLNVKEVYHSPSPLFTNKYESNIIKENQNLNNQINFDEEQKINDN